MKPVWIFTLSFVGLILVLIFCPRHIAVSHKKPVAKVLSVRKSLDQDFSTGPLVRNAYRGCFVRHAFYEAWIACGSKEWATYVAGMQQTSALKYACHVMGRNWNATTCCPFGQRQVGCVVNLPCRCVTPKKGHFYTAWMGYS